MNNFTSPSSLDAKAAHLKQQIDLYLNHWKLFLVFILISLFCGVLYLRYAQKMYYTQAMILLQDEKQASGEMAGLAELANLAGRTSSSAAYVNDQTQILRSRRILRKVVDANELHISYFIKGKIRESELLKSQSPIQILIQKPANAKLDSVVYEINVSKTKAGFQIWDELSEKRDYTLGQNIHTPIGPIALLPSGHFTDWIGEIRIQVLPKDFAVNILQGMVNIESNSKEQSFAIRLSTETTSPAKGEMILNSLIHHYDQDRSYDKETIFRNTSAFINSRLELINKDLKAADSRVANFKGDNELADIQAQTQLLMKDASEQERKLVEYQTQLYLSEIVRESSNEESFSLLPSNIGLTDQTVQSLIKFYNELILERSDLLRSSTAQSPVLINIERNLSMLKDNLLTSLDNLKKGIEVNINSLQSERQKLTGKLSKFPNQELQFRDISRQQKVVESIYLFLLQKREENEINSSATPANIKIVDYAYGYTVPVAPRKLYVLIGALVLGLLIPFGLLYLKFLMDNKIHSKKDLEELIGAPVLGQVPKVDEKIVQENSRTSLAEALRIIRTNIAFMLGAENQHGKIIYVTSTISGEGKSFIATNLSSIIAQSGKKVLLIGADIRSPKVLEYLGVSHLKHTNIGITQYLLDPAIPVDKLVLKYPQMYAFDIIYSGYIAPNPAELLMNGNFKGIIDYARKEYDYVIVDTAPVSLVTDTLLISEFADITIYVSRADYLDKRLTEIPRELYIEGKLKNMALVLNDVDFKSGYGYGYGYGYGEPVNKQKNILARFSHNIKKILKLEKNNIDL